MFVILAILAMFLYNFFGVNVTTEGFLFSAPDQCKTICARLGNGYGTAYCQSPYLKDSTASMCNCVYNKQTGICEGSLAGNGRCAL